jgi:hypothetical protein
MIAELRALMVELSDGIVRVRTWTQLPPDASLPEGYAIDSYRGSHDGWAYLVAQFTAPEGVRWDGTAAGPGGVIVRLGPEMSKSGFESASRSLGGS